MHNRSYFNWRRFPWSLNFGDSLFSFAFCEISIVPNKLIHLFSWWLYYYSVIICLQLATVMILAIADGCTGAESRRILHVSFIATSRLMRGYFSKDLRVSTLVLSEPQSCRLFWMCICDSKGHIFEVLAFADHGLNLPQVSLVFNVTPPPVCV